MFPSSFRANRLAACSVLLKTYDEVWYIGTALEPVVGSGFSCPTWMAKVSSFLFGHFLIAPFCFVKHQRITPLYPFLWVLFQKEYQPSNIDALACFHRSEDIGKKRRQLGLKQAELAKMAGVSQSLIAKLEAGTIDSSYTKVKTILRRP